MNFFTPIALLTDYWVSEWASERRFGVQFL